MVGVLADRALYRYTGQETPPTLDELRARYAAQTRGPRPPSTDLWGNWVVRADGEAVGYVQATIHPPDDAELAWVIGTAHQGRGYAGEAAAALAEAVLGAGVKTLIAHIHPKNAASRRIAERLGMTKQPGHPFDGEDRWAL